MNKETIELYICDYCKQKHTDVNWMEMHEEICPMNPKNQPCSKCENQILSIGCGKGMKMESVGGNVECFFYKEGYPKNPFENLIRLDKEDDNYED